MIQISQKETSLLKDLKDAEQLCIDKYTRHSSQASDPQLKNLFSQLAQNEQSHLNTLCQIENGQTPSVNSGSQSMPTFTMFNGSAQDKDKVNGLLPIKEVVDAGFADEYAFVTDVMEECECNKCAASIDIISKIRVCA